MTAAFVSVMRRQRAIGGLCAIISTVSVTAGCAYEPVNPISGPATFATHCAACHGSSAEGNGPVAATLNVPVPNLRTLTQRNGTFPTEWVASKIDGRDLPAAHGDRAMPVWGSVFDTTTQLFVESESSEQRINAVIEFLLGLQLPGNR
jgi:mono/diheme cytochrome c family protein